MSVFRIEGEKVNPDRGRFIGYYGSERAARSMTEALQDFAELNPEEPHVTNLVVTVHGAIE
jgi:hypothetical protein